MPVRQKDTDSSEVTGTYGDSVIFEASPGNLDLDKELETKIHEHQISFDAEKLAKVLVDVGQKLLGVELYEYQLEPAYRIFYSMLIGDGAEITLLFSRQSGKSEVVTFCIVIIGVVFPVLGKNFKDLEHFKDGVKMGLFAPQLDQVETVYFRCMDRLKAEATRVLLDDPDINDQLLSKVNFKLRSGSFLKAQTGAKQSKIESKTYHIVFIDESQDMDTEKVRKSIIPMTASTYGTIVRLGTPNRLKGDFYYTIQNNKREDRKNKMHPSKRKHFEYNYKDIIKAKNNQYKKDNKKFHTLYALAVERDKTSMGGINGEVFRMAYALEWMFDIGMFVTEESLNEYVYDKRKKWPEITKDTFQVAGLDIASARAQTVLTLGICEHSVKQEFGEKPKKILADWMVLDGSYEEQYPLIEDFLVANNVKILYADYTGVGRVVVDRLMANIGNHILIIPYTFSLPSKSDMWKNLDEEILAGRFKVPAHPEVARTAEFQAFEEQMLNLQKFWKGSYMICEKVQGFKDDFCDSAALMAMAGNHLYNPTTFEVSDNFLTSRNNRGRSYSNSSW